jgi:drug/metabolite transporter (DMT)-like permease
MTVKGKTLSLMSKVLSVILAAIAVIVAITEEPIDMNKVIAGCIFIAGSFIAVDVSKVKAAGRFPAENKEEI